MDWVHIADNWINVKMQFSKHFPRLTNDDLSAVDGRKSLLVTRLADAYGWTEMVAEKKIDDLIPTLALRQTNADHGRSGDAGTNIAVKDKTAA